MAESVFSLSSVVHDADDERWDVVKRYIIDDESTLEILFPPLASDRKFLSEASQNQVVVCMLLRQYLDAGSYNWNAHPDCMTYNKDQGCFLILPFTVRDYNDDNPYGTVLEFLRDFQSNPSVNSAPLNQQRNWLYRLLNEAIGGPVGKVHVPIFQFRS